MISKPNHCSLSLILSFAVTVAIWPREVVFLFVAISFYTLSLLFGSSRLSKLTLAGPHFTILFALFSVAVQFKPNSSSFVTIFAVLCSCFKPRELGGGVLNKCLYKTRQDKTMFYLESYSYVYRLYPNNLKL